MTGIIENAERNIWQALKDYGAHTDQTEVLDDVTEDFIHRLAVDSSHAKRELRELFRKSPVYDEKLDALVINGTRTHDPDYCRVYNLAVDILRPVLEESTGTYYSLITKAIAFFLEEQTETERVTSIAAINALAPKAYVPNKKPSRVFKSLCVALGVADETAGSEFQKLYAQFADELSAKKIGFKLYVSLNPAHFITMSNPKGDNRGTCLTSCHSFNSTDYNYNCGCSGYARDRTSFIAFTVADPTDAETLNNRKTTRQVFAYKPGNGLLLQSRMYNTSGGTYGAQEESTLYRDLIQRELSMLEDQPNLWKTSSYLHGHEGCVSAGSGFGGYQDWTYENFEGKVSIRADHLHNWKRITVGTSGLCISCGCEISEGLYCDCCKYDGLECCDCCGRHFDEDDMYDVRDERGNWIRVCEGCRDDEYTYCDRCEEYWPADMVTEINGRYYCPDCRDEIAEQCEDCDEWCLREDMVCVHNEYGEAWVCESCCDEYYSYCEDCDEYHPADEMIRVEVADGGHKYVCKSCVNDYEPCPLCNARIERREGGTCPSCGAVIDVEEEEIA